MTVAMRADGMVVWIRRQIAAIVDNGRSDMGGLEFYSTSRSIDGRDQNEDGDKQRDERSHDGVTVNRPDHAAT
jgi:hypothetical protein